jgi:hypothetical protein
MSDRQFAVSGVWALAADRLQWILQRQRTRKGKTETYWNAVSFVSSDKDILARCMREKGVPPKDARRLLAGLPSTFKEWRKDQAKRQDERVYEPEAALPTPAGE